MPFAWIASVSGSRQADGVDASGGESLFESVTHIDFAGLFHAEAGKGEISLRLCAL
jgi:hypothetical protein